MSTQSIQEKQNTSSDQSFLRRVLIKSLQFGGIIGFPLLGYGAYCLLSNKTNQFERLDLQLWQTRLNIFGGIAGSIGIGCGAFGFHELRKFLTPTRKNVDQLIKIWEIATQYLLIHAVALVAVGGRSCEISVPSQAAFAAGICLFSGGLFVYVLSNIKAFQYITPFGAMAYVIGWAAFAVNTYLVSKQRRKERRLKQVFGGSIFF